MSALGAEVAGSSPAILNSLLWVRSLMAERLTVNQRIPVQSRSDPQPTSAVLGGSRAPANDY